MQVSSVSFGKKIPVMQCQIKDIKQNKLVGAKLSKYDCKDYEDILEVSNSCSKWCYIRNILKDMETKYIKQNRGKENILYDFYILENEEGKAIGFCETESSKECSNIEYIVSKHDNNYKYIGQALIAMVGKSVLNRGGHRLYVANPAPSANGFYTNKCGFIRLDERSFLSPLWLEKDGIEDLINKFQEKTQSEISDIEG